MKPHPPAKKCLFEKITFLYRRALGDNWKSVKFSNYQIRRSVDQGIQTLLPVLDSRAQF